MTTGTMNQRTRSPRHPRADGERTRAAILRAATSLATGEGLEGLSIGHLADAIGMSKSGLYAHFGSKQELQLATVEEAERILDEEVVQPALAARPGRAQLAAVCEAYLSYVQRRVFPGGCFFAVTALAMGARRGGAPLGAGVGASLGYRPAPGFPGGCFLRVRALGVGPRPGPVKDRIAAIQSGFAALLSTFAATAVEQHELPPGENPDRLA